MIFEQSVNKSGGGTPPPTELPPKFDPKMPIGKLMLLLFNAAAGLYEAITGDSLRVMNGTLNRLTNREQQISDELAAANAKKKPDTTTLSLLKNELAEVQTRVQKMNATISTTMSSASTMVAILGKIVAVNKEAINGIIPQI